MTTFINQQTGEKEEFDLVNGQWVKREGLQEKLLEGGAQPGVALSLQDIQKIMSGGRISPQRQLGTDASQFQPLQTDPAQSGMEAFLNAMQLGSTNIGAGLGRLTRMLSPEEASQTMAVEQARLRSPEFPITSLLGEATGEALSFPFPGSIGATLPAKIGSSAVTGGALGATSAAGRGGDPVTGGVIGAGAGAVIPPALIGFGKGVASLPGVAQRIVQSLSPRGAAQKAVERAFERDRIPVEDVLKQAAELGPEARLVDLGGENVRKLAQTIAHAPGQAAEVAKTELTGRAKRSVQRMIRSAQIATGEDRSAFQTTAKIIEARKALADPLYKEANRELIQVSGPLAELMSRDAMKQAFKKGAIKASNDLDWPAGIKINRVVEEGKTYPLAAFDYAKRALDDKIGAAIRSGKKDDVRILTGLKNELLSQVDEIVPSYRAARDIFSDMSAMNSAIEQGKKILSSDAEETAALVQGMTVSEKEMFTIGAMKAITDKFKGTIEGGNASRRFATELIKERIKPAFRSEDDFQRFTQALDNEGVFAQSANILGGSPTQPRQVAAGQLAGETAVDLAQTGLVGSALNTIRQLVSREKNIPENIRDEIGEILFRESFTTKTSPKVIRTLRRKGLSKKKIDALLDASRGTLAKLTASAGAQSLGPISETINGQ